MVATSIICSKNITLPELIERKNFAGNTISRIYSKAISVAVNIHSSPFDNIFELHTELEAPFSIIYLKNKNDTQDLPKDIPYLYLDNKINLDKLTIETKLKWGKHPFYTTKITSPNSVLQSWANKFQFIEDIPEIKQAGLRRPQLGALHALSAYFSSEKNTEPATVVLPTGTGKTETMLAALFYQRCNKILIIVPSNSLREQISQKFLTLGYLPTLGVIPFLSALPYVTKLRKGIKTEHDAIELVKQSNVIVATAAILNSSESSAVDALCANCSHLFIDEAHHVSANSWSEIRTRFAEKSTIQFTATPFRNDKDSLGGKIIFNYSMGEAQKAGYFRKINLYPVEEYYQDKIDLTIANQAIIRLREDLSKGYDHLMMVRVSKQERANEVFGIYLKIAKDFNPIIVHSGNSRSENEIRLSALLSRKSRIVICVDMLGEGYDLPNLKIAAIHDYHKSLAITLQFIGRFTRSSQSEKINDASVIVNIADPSTEEALKKLYAQDADWDVVLRRLSENRIEREIELQDIVDSLKQNGDLSNQLSLWNLTPSFSVMMFKTECEDWSPEKYDIVLPKCEEYWHALSVEKNILVVLAIQSLPVKWGNFKELREIDYKLLIAHWDKERQGLFIYSNDYKSFKPDVLAKNLCGENVEAMSGMKVFNVLNNIAYPLVKNLGTSQTGAISFTQFFGSNVTEGLSSVEKSSSELSNIAALGYENGERIIWGCSQRKGKIWSPQKSGNITDWIYWSTSAWDKVIKGDPEDTNITRDFLRPEKIVQNHSSVPLSIQWGEYIQLSYEDRTFILFNDVKVPLYEVDLSVKQGNENSIEIIISSQQYNSIYQMNINQEGATYSLISGEEIYFQVGNKEVVRLSEQMLSDPLFIYYIDGSFSYNHFHVKIPNNVGVFNQDKLSVLDWSGINIQKESMGYKMEKDTVQFKILSQIESSYDIIINDDGSGEAADLVAIKLLDNNEIALHLYHCKYSSESIPGKRVTDLYEVCGQAQRCIRWKHLGLARLYLHIKNREQLSAKKGQSRFIKGSISQFADFKNMARTMPVKFYVTIVQPGVSSSSITEEMLKLLGTTELFIKKTTQADLDVICSK